MTAWADGSGANNNLADALLGPALTAAVLDGKPSLRFNGTTNLLSVNYSGGALGVTFTYACVFAKRGNVGQDVVMGAAAAPDCRLETNGTAYRIFQGSLLSGGTADTSPHVAIAVFDATDTLSIDGAAAAISGSGGTNNPTSLRLGANTTPSAFADMDFFSAVVCTGAMSAGNQANLRAYWKAKYPSLP